MAHRARSVRFTEAVELMPTSGYRQVRSPSAAATSPSQYLSPDAAFSPSRDAQPIDQQSPASAQQPPSQLRPRRSLVMRGRIRRLEQDYGYETGLPEHAPRRVNTRRSSLPLRRSQQFSAENPPHHGATEGQGELQRKPSRIARWLETAGVGRGAGHQQRSTEDSLGLVEHGVTMAGSPAQRGLGPSKHELDEDQVGHAVRGETYELQTRRLTHGYESIDSLDKVGEDHDSGVHVHGQDAMRRKRSLVERIHGDRPDRHLFPYRSSQENLHAVGTFFRRFFLIVLVLPAYIIPYLLNEKAENSKDSHGEGAGAHGAEMSKAANMSIFFLNMLCMMHLGKAAGACLEELVPKLGAHVVSVFDAMTSSTVELAVAAFALKKGLVRVVQAAMLGAILNNLLLILGITIVVGGMYHKEQELEPDTTQTGMNILMLATISFIVPVTLSGSLTSQRMLRIPPALTGTELIDATLAVRRSVDHDILTLSKILAVILLFMYAACLSYQYMNRHFLVTPEDKHSEEYTVHERHTHYWFAGLAYVTLLGMQIYSANLLVHAVEALGRQFKLNDAFVGFILLPIVLVADLQEEVIAIKESKHGRLDRSVALMIGSCMQIALLVTPLLVILGWIIGQPMNFRFTIMESTILVVSVLLVNFLIQDSKTNYLEGVLLLASFLLAAMAFYYDKEPFSMLDGGNSIGGHSESGGGH